jgi:hypothetical protein
MEGYNDRRKYASANFYTHMVGIQAVHGINHFVAAGINKNDPIVHLFSTSNSRI